MTYGFTVPADCLPVIVLGAFLLDLVWGDPPRWPHPVAGMGKMIARLEERLNAGASGERRRRGVGVALLVAGGTYLLVWLAVWGAKTLHPLLGFGVSVYFIFTSLATTSLLEAGKSVLLPLEQGDLETARERLSRLVGRDTDKLGEEEVVRGTLETLAENFVDGILSPLFYAALGGAPLAMAFKAVSTLDSMVGYRNERYEDFGWFSARLDDWANYIPARLAVGFLLLAGWLKGLPAGRAFRIWRRDASSHPSPNGGNPESVAAGLLGVRLGGFNSYRGQVQYRAEMGDALQALTPYHIVQCCSLIRAATWLALGPALAVAYVMFRLIS